MTKGTGGGAPCFCCWYHKNEGVAPWGWRYPYCYCYCYCWYHKHVVAPLVVVGTWGWVGAMRGSRT